MKYDRPTSEILHSRDFYETLRNEVAPCMTLVAVCDEGKLYYWDDFVSIMLVVGPDFVALSYAWARGAESSVELIRECCEAVHDPTKIKKMAALFCYMASLDTETGYFQLHNVRGGDWLGIYPRAKRSVLRKLFYRLPHGWPGSYRSTVEQLNQGRGRDDSLASQLDNLTSNICQTLYSIKFANTAATFDVQYGRRLPLENGKLSPYGMPIETRRPGELQIRDDFRCEVDIQLADHYLSECGIITTAVGESRLPNNESIEIPAYGLAAVAFLIERLPDVAVDGKTCFCRCLRFIPTCNFDYREMAVDLNYHQIGSGVIILKALFEGLLSLGGDLFTSKTMRSTLGRLGEDLDTGALSTAMEIQERVILELCRVSTGNEG